LLAGFILESRYCNIDPISSSLLTNTIQDKTDTQSSHDPRRRPPDLPVFIIIIINASETYLGQIEGIQSQSPFGISILVSHPSLRANIFGLTAFALSSIDHRARWTCNLSAGPLNPNNRRPTDKLSYPLLVAYQIPLFLDNLTSTRRTIE
jgi:hypothetical protein